MQAQMQGVPSSGSEGPSPAEIEIMESVEKFSHTFTAASEDTLNKLLAAKNQLNQNKKVIEETFENLKQDCVSLIYNLTLLF